MGVRVGFKFILFEMLLTGFLYMYFSQSRFKN